MIQKKAITSLKENKSHYFYCCIWNSELRIHDDDDDDNDDEDDEGICRAHHK